MWGIFPFRKRRMNPQSNVPYALGGRKPEPRNAPLPLYFGFVVGFFHRMYGNVVKPTRSQCSIILAWFGNIRNLPLILRVASPTFIHAIPPSTRTRKVSCQT